MSPRLFEYVLEHLPGRAYVRDAIEVRGLRNLDENAKIGRGLHVSCGDGVATRTIVKHFSPEQMYGVDASAEAISKALGDPENKAIDFSVQSPVKLSFEDGYFDAVFDLADLHNYSNWRTAIDEIHRVTKPGGLIFIEDMSAETFEYASGKFFKAFTVHPYESMMRLDEFRMYAEDIGFEILRFEVINQLGLFKFFRMLGKKR